MARRLLLTFALLATSTVVSGCNSGRISDENSRLRRENLALSEKLNAQEMQIVRLQKQNEGLSALLDQPKPAVEGVKRSDIPVATRITFGRYSGAMDDDGDGNDDTIRLYVLTEDQKGRFIPVAGKAVFQIVVINSERGVFELANKRYGAQEFDRTYNSGLTGTHYTFEASIPKDLPPGLAGRPSEVTARITLVDANSGNRLTHQMLVPIK